MGNSASEQFAQFLCTWADIPDSEISKALEIFQPVSVSKGMVLVRAGVNVFSCGICASVSGALRRGDTIAPRTALKRPWKTGASRRFC